MSDRKEINARYYAANKEKIAARQREKKAWKKYYETHKDVILAKQKIRASARKAAARSSTALAEAMNGVAALLEASEEKSPGVPCIEGPLTRHMTLGAE